MLGRSLWKSDVAASHVACASAVFPSFSTSSQFVKLYFSWYWKKWQRWHWAPNLENNWNILFQDLLAWIILSTVLKYMSFLGFANHIPVTMVHAVPEQLFFSVPRPGESLSPFSVVWLISLSLSTTRYKNNIVKLRLFSTIRDSWRHWIFINTIVIIFITEEPPLILTVNSSFTPSFTLHLIISCWSVSFSSREKINK